MGIKLCSSHERKTFYEIDSNYKIDGYVGINIGIGITSTGVPFEV